MLPVPVSVGDLFPFGDLDDELLANIRERLPHAPIETAGALIELGRSAVSLLETMAATLEEVGLSPARWRLLMAAAFQSAPEGATVGELARHLQVRESTVSVTIDRLEGELLVERTRDPDDRRVVRIRVTEQGQDLVARIAPMIGARMGPIVEALGGPARTREMAQTISAATSGEKRVHRSAS